MKTINVASAFTLVLGPAKMLSIPAGVQSVEDEVADHWFTKAHLAHGGLGTPEYAAAARQAADSAFVEAKALVDKYQGLEEAAHDAEVAAGLDPSSPAHARLGVEEPVAEAEEVAEEDEADEDETKEEVEAEAETETETETEVEGEKQADEGPAEQPALSQAAVEAAPAAETPKAAPKPRAKAKAKDKA